MAEGAGLDWRWMYWTTPTAVFFALIFLAITVMIFWEMHVPTEARRGFLPIMTTRGERLFIILLGSAFIHLGWVGLVEASPWFALALSAAYGGLVARWG